MNGQFLTPEDFQTIMGSSTYPEEMKDLELQLALAEQLRGQQPQMRQAGRTSVAANPLEFVGSTVKEMRANKMMKQALEQQKLMIEALRKARGTYGKNVMSMGESQQPQTGFPVGDF